MTNLTTCALETGKKLQGYSHKHYSGPCYSLLIALMIAFIAVVTPARGDVINEDLKFIASDGTIGDELGSSVSIDNGVVVIGAPSDDDNGTDAGAAYLFDASTGTQIAKLLASDGGAGAEFGFSVAISNGIVAVGARADDENGAYAGAAYLFDASTGAQLAKLTPNDAEAGDEFGNSIAIDNGIVAVGAWRADEYGDASGAAYLFDASTGNQLDKLLPDTGNNYQTFGVSIAMDAGIVAIGARTYFVLGEGYTFAKAYLFDVSTGNQLNVLQPDILNYRGDLGGNFADCIDIDNGLVAVGTPFRSVFFDFSGAIYVFDASTGDQLHFIFPADGHDRDNFGISISIDNGLVAVGAHQDGDNGFNSGSAYLYDALTGTEISKLLSSDGAQFDLFGTSVAVNGGVTIVGATGDNDNGDDSGSAYIFSDSSNGIDCAEVRDLRARCTQAGGTMLQSMLRFWNSNYDGTTVTFEINGSDRHVATVSNSQARFSLPNYGAGTHTITVVEADACVGSVTATCTAAFDDEGNVGMSETFPESTELLGNYPNPFNPSTTIRYSLSEATHVTLKIYNTLGQEVATLVDGRQEGGQRDIQWDGRDNTGNLVASGIYIYRLKAGEAVDTSQMLFSR